MKLSACVELFQDRRILIFIASAVLFHFANAAMLPLVGQKSSDGIKDGAAVVMSACIIAAQLVMIPVGTGGESAVGVVGPQAGLPDRLWRFADSWLALLPERQSGLSGRRAASRRNRRGHLRGRVGYRGRRPHQGNGPIQPDTGGSRHGDRCRSRLSNLWRASWSRKRASTPASSCSPRSPRSARSSSALAMPGDATGHQRLQKSWACGSSFRKPQVNSDRSYQETPADENIVTSRLSLSYPETCISRGRSTKTRAAAHQVIDEINMLIRPDFVQFIGDNVQDATEDQFQLFDQIRGRLEVPHFALVGDHDIKDDPGAVGFASRLASLMRDHGLNGVRFIRLNTQESRPTGISAGQIDWFRQ